MFFLVVIVIIIFFYMDFVVVNWIMFILCKVFYDINFDLVYMWIFNGKLIDFEKEFYYRLVRFFYICI